MVFSKKLVRIFWKICARNDKKRLSKQTYPTDLVEVNNLKYDDDGHRYHQLDVYYPKNTKGKLPVIVDIHGGGWFYGDKELNKNYCLHLAQKGFVVFNISYRLAPEVKVNEQVQDCMKALLFVSKAMKNFPCNENKVFLVGDSAGGQLAAFATAANASETIRKTYVTVASNLNICAVGLISPVAYLKPKGFLRLYLPHIVGSDYLNQTYADYVNVDKVIEACEEYPPVILFTSVMDVVARRQTKKLYRYLKKNDKVVKLDFSYNPFLNHVYQVLNPEGKSSVKAINCLVKFFKKNS